MRALATPLQRGRHSLPRAQVADIQRARIVGAMVEVAAEHGYLDATVARVVKRARISRRTFYDLFDSREDAFLAAFDWGVEQTSAQMAAAYAREPAWRDGVRSALASLLVFLDAEPQLARACVVQALGAGPLVLARRAEAMQRFARALDADAPPMRGTPQPRLLTAEAVIGGAFSVVHTRLSVGGQAQQQPLTDLLGRLMALIALPYLGARAAAHELARPVPKFPAPATAADTRAADRRVLERLDLRLTYRTVRCLSFVAGHPNASNREIARGSNIKDEGQASKLLARLAGMDLLVRTASGPGKANAWRLSSQGERILGALPSAQPWG